MGLGPTTACLLALATAALPLTPVPAALPVDAEVLVIGSGIAGLSAALEASDAGARVLVLDANSVGGGHAVKAGGFALVGTPLQESKGYHDTPDIAYRDLMAWGEDADPGWVRRYVEGSRADVHDWLAGFGVRFTFILETPEHSVPRFHFAGGSAANVVVPMLRAALRRPNVSLRWNTEALGLARAADGALVVESRDLRTGVEARFRARSVILATGGYQSNLGQVRTTWKPGARQPARLYAGAGQFATGTGLRLAEALGAQVTRLDHQAIFTAGFPDPGDPSGQRALLAQNPAAIWVNTAGRRFVDERAPSKVTDAAVLALDPATHWLIFDATGARSLRIRDAVWLGNPDAAARLAAAPNAHQAGSLDALAAATGLPAAALAATVARYNAALQEGTDVDFGRFSPQRPDKQARPIVAPPFHAVQLFPLARKSMGGVRVDDRTRALDGQGNAIAGLYAIGEVTGVAGVNGSHGGEGTFLGPSVYMGRIAGRDAAQGPGQRHLAANSPPLSPPQLASAPGVTTDRTRTVTVAPESLASLVAASRPGYWHFGQVHQTVAARSLDCLRCHGPVWPTRTAMTAAEQQAELESCSTCH